MFPTDPTLLSTLQHPHQLFDQLGSFWRSYLVDQDLLRYHQFAKLQLHADVYLRSVELAAASSIQQIHPFSARQWRLIRLLKSELTQDPNKIRFGTGKAYGDGTVYGQLAAQSYIWQLPADIREIGLLVDHVVEPTVIYDVSNCSFDPTTNELRFAVNPFDRLTTLPVYDDAGTLIDQQVLLFARNVAEDRNEPYLRFGSILGLQGTSSRHYVDVLRACWAMLVKGPSIEDLTDGLLASVGLPVTVGDEVVEIVTVDLDGLAIITDHNVYRYHPSATPLVTVGDRLTAGQALVDTVQVFEYASGQPRDLSVLPGLAAGSDLLDGVAGTVVFPNLDEHWTVGADGDVRFSLFGDQADVDAFWAQVHARGLAAGQTLAQLVDVRAPGVVRAVNPLRFVLDHLIGSNLIVVVLRPQHFLAAESGFFSRIKSFVNRGTLLLVQIDLQQVDDVLDLSTATTSATLEDALLAPTEVASVSGTDLTFTDHDPLISVT